MSFDQDPGESVTLSGSDFAMMKDEIRTLRVAADLHAQALEKARALGFSTVELALAATEPAKASVLDSFLDGARSVLEEGLTIYEKGQRGGVMAEALSMAIGGPCKLCGQPNAMHLNGKCPPPSRLTVDSKGILRDTRFF